MADGPTYSDDALMGQAYLVARGARMLAIIRSCPVTAARETYPRLRSRGESPAIPFVVNHSPEWAMFGYASHAWVLDLLTFSASLPATQHDRILGLLLGYSPDAIRSFEEGHSGTPIWLPPPESSSQPFSFWDSQEKYDPAPS